MKKDACFESERLFFRGIGEEDAEWVTRWRSDLDLIRYFRYPQAITLDGHREWFRKSYWHDACRYDFMIMDRISKKRIGTVGVNALDWENGSCEISYMIGEKDFQRRGLASEAIAAMMRYIEQEGKIGDEGRGFCFYAEIHRDNRASLRAVEKLGFLRCGQREEFVWLMKVVI